MKPDSKQKKKGQKSMNISERVNETNESGDDLNMKILKNVYELRDGLIKLEAVLKAAGYCISESYIRDDSRPDPLALTDVALTIIKNMFDTADTLEGRHVKRMFDEHERSAQNGGNRPERWAGSAATDPGKTDTH